MIKSQDELNPCNDGHRSSEVLVATIEKLEQTQKKLDKAEIILNKLANGYQSRNAYDELIRMGKAYFKELEK